LLKKKNNYSKHDLRRRIQTNELSMLNIVERISVIEKVFNDFIEMEGLEKKFKKFLDGKYKQSEDKQG
jgi:lipid A disaccharide synthetase